MKCSKCGAELKKDSNFCPFCGMKVETETFVSSAKYKGEPDKKESAPQITSTPLARKPSIANEKAKLAKDVAAGGVLILAIGAAIVGLIIFLPKAAEVIGMI